jgi:hypothetical protein
LIDHWGLFSNRWLVPATVERLLLRCLLSIMQVAIMLRNQATVGDPLHERPAILSCLMGYRARRRLEGADPRSRPTSGGEMGGDGADFKMTSLGRRSGGVWLLVWNRETRVQLETSQRQPDAAVGTAGVAGAAASFGKWHAINLLKSRKHGRRPRAIAI